MISCDWDRIIYDAQYIWLNCLINQIPSWKIRRFFYLKTGMMIGKDARIGIGTRVLEPRNIVIGARSVINENCILDGRGGLRIGHDTSLSSGTSVLTASHRLHAKNFDYYTKRVTIGNYVWTGTGATILDGSLISDFSVIGAGAVMKGRTKEKEVWLGNPAKYVKKRRISSNYKLKYKVYFR